MEVKIKAMSYETMALILYGIGQGVFGIISFDYLVRHDTNVQAYGTIVGQTTVMTFFLFLLMVAWIANAWDKDKSHVSNVSAASSTWVAEMAVLVCYAINMALQWGFLGNHGHYKTPDSNFCNTKWGPGCHCTVPCFASSEFVPYQNVNIVNFVTAIVLFMMIVQAASAIYNQHSEVTEPLVPAMSYQAHAPPSNWWLLSLAYSAIIVDLLVVATGIMWFISLVGKPSAPMLYYGVEELIVLIFLVFFLCFFIYVRGFVTPPESDVKMFSNYFEHTKGLNITLYLASMCVIFNGFFLLNFQLNEEGKKKNGNVGWGYNVNFGNGHENLYQAFRAMGIMNVVIACAAMYSFVSLIMHLDVFRGAVFTRIFSLFHTPQTKSSTRGGVLMRWLDVTWLLFVLVVIGVLLDQLVQEKGTINQSFENWMITILVFDGAFLLLHAVVAITNWRTNLGVAGERRLDKNSRQLASMWARVLAYLFIAISWIFTFQRFGNGAGNIKYSLLQDPTKEAGSIFYATILVTLLLQFLYLYIAVDYIRFFSWEFVFTKQEVSVTVK